MNIEQDERLREMVFWLNEMLKTNYEADIAWSKHRHKEFFAADERFQLASRRFDEAQARP